MIVEDSVRFDIVIQWTNTHPNLEVDVHMREVALIDSSNIIFGGCIWKQWTTNWRTILHYPKAILANI